MLGKKEIEPYVQSLYYLPVGIVWFIKDKIIYNNLQAVKFLKLDQLKNLKLDSIFPIHELEKITDISQKLSKKDKHHKEVLVINLNDKRTLKSEIQIIEIENQKIIQLSFLEDDLNNSESEILLFNTLLETSNQLIWFINHDFELTAFNNNYKKFIKDLYQADAEIGQNIKNKYGIKDKSFIDFWLPKYNDALGGKKINFIKEENHKKKSFWQVFINPVFNNKKSIQEICCVAIDVTNSVENEQKIISQRGRLTSIFDSSQHYIWTIDENEKLTSFNKNYFDLITNVYGVQPGLGLVLDRGVLNRDQKYIQLLKNEYKTAFNGTATTFEVEIQDQENKTIYLEIFLNPILEKNRVVEVSGIAQNITEKKIAHQKMEISLKEKEVLLKEVHHRVKNNMQVISSILNLQSFYVTDNYALSLLKESQNRISTMAYIHESLYLNSSFSSVNFSDYVRDLVRNIIASYSVKADKIKLKQNLGSLALSLDYSIPLGLIINELVTNSIKHAFPNKEKGTITINLKSENNFVFLELMDDGVGLPQGISVETSQSLGLQLVSTLIEQIEATYKINSIKNKGTTFNISFKV